MQKWLEQNYPAVIVVALMIIGLSLRLYHIDFQPLVYDEEFTQLRAIDTISGILSTSFGADANPPTYYILAHYSGIFLGGATAFAIRLPAAIFSVLTIPVAYLIGKEYRGEILGIITAIAATFTYNLIFYGMFARAYSLSVLAFSLVFLFFLKLYHGDSSRVNKILFVASITLSLWAHFFAAVPILLLSAILILKYRSEILWYFSIPAVSCLPFLMYLTLVRGRMGENYGLPMDTTAMTIPIEVLWVPVVWQVPLVAYSAWKGDPVARILSWVSLTSAVILLVTLAVTPAFPRYILCLSVPLIAAGYAQVSDFIESFTREQKAATIACIAFATIAVSYTPMLALYFISMKPIFGL